MPTNVRLSGSNPGDPREESDIRVNYNNLQQIICGSTKLGASQPMHYSGDGGGTWSQSSLPPFAGDARQGDPTIDWTADGTAWTVTIGITPTLQGRLRCYKSTTGGASWTFDSTIPGGQSAMDKQSLWVDHSSASPHHDAMYVMWDNTGPGFVSVRPAGGTWQAPLPLSGAETTGTAIGSDIKTNTFGDVFAFWHDTGSRNVFAMKSTNGATSFTPPVPAATTFLGFQVGVPAQDGRRVLTYPSGGAYRTATKDLVYVTWVDLAGGAGCNSPGNEPGTNTASTCKTRVYFTRSTDGGTTWEAPRKISDQSSLNDQIFQRLAVDETNGELVVVYYDTVGDPGRTKTNFVMQRSSDDGVSWSAPVAITTAQTDETTAGSQANFQYGDYIGLTGHAGQFFACWTDRRSGGTEEIWGAAIPVVQPACYFNIDRDHYGADEIDGVRVQSPAMPKTAIVTTAFWVVVDGFTASELGIVDQTSTNVGPPVTFTTPSSAVAPGVTATCTSLTSDNPAFPQNELQRFRFGYDVNFGVDDTAFTSFPGDTETITLTTSFHGLPATGQVQFIKQPDPYIQQGAQTWWLSSDIRLIQVAAGDSAFGVPMGNDPYQFLTNLTGALETGQGTAGGVSFDANTTEDNEVISVAPQTMRNGQLVNVYNFAIARVHYRGNLSDANHVRVFFRLFAANSTNTTFEPGRHTTYGRVPETYPVPAAQFGNHVTPAAGVLAGEYVTVPCFGTVRQTPTQAGAPNTLPSLQFDAPINDRLISHTGGVLHDTFYGCFLDINQAQGVFPQGGTAPAGNEDGPWPPGTGVTLEPLRLAFIRNEHQCLVAEIAFDPDPIATGVQPWNSDKLAQRNISWSSVAQ